MLAAIFGLLGEWFPNKIIPIPPLSDFPCVGGIRFCLCMTYTLSCKKNQLQSTTRLLFCIAFLKHFNVSLKMSLFHNVRHSNGFDFVFKLFTSLFEMQNAAINTKRGTINMVRLIFSTERVTSKENPHIIRNHLYAPACACVCFTLLYRRLMNKV